MSFLEFVGAVAVSFVVIAAVAASWRSPLGLLNFAVLQWFGIRLARVRLARCVRYVDAYGHRHTLHAHWGDGRSCSPLEVDEETANKVSWSLLRWVWPLTGWWSDYRWIARRPRPIDPAAKSTISIRVRVVDDATPQLKRIVKKLNKVRR